MIPASKPEIAIVSDPKSFSLKAIWLCHNSLNAASKVPLVPAKAAFRATQYYVIRRRPSSAQALLVEIVRGDPALTSENCLGSIQLAVMGRFAGCFLWSRRHCNCVKASSGNLSKDHLTGERRVDFENGVLAVSLASLQ